MRVMVSREWYGCSQSSSFHEDMQHVFVLEDLSSSEMHSVDGRMWELVPVVWFRAHASGNGFNVRYLHSRSCAVISASVLMIEWRIPQLGRILQYGKIMLQCNVCKRI